jgi:hypothetical protein
MTGHARQRISERSVTAEESILSMLDGGLFVPIGTETGTNRSHELLYLPGDGHWFVAIRDIRTLELITFLPIDYHENIAWKVSFDAMQEARRMVTGEKRREEAEPHTHARLEPTTLKISLIYELDFIRTARKSLGTYPIVPGFATGELFSDPSFGREMLERIARKGIPLDSTVCIAVRKRKHDDEALLLSINHFTGELEPLIPVSAAC